MSNAALRWAFQLEMRDPSAKAVLIALADHANEQWTCWPSVARLCLFTALGERTVQRALRRLSADGRITLCDRHGQSRLVTLVADDTPSQRHPSPVTVTPTPVTVTPEPSITPTEPPGDSHARCSEARGTRLAPDWRPGPAERAYAHDRGLDPDLLAEEFRTYWCAVPGARGRKLDWPATFRNRCLQRAGRTAIALRADGVAAAAERVLRRRGLDLA